MRRINITENSRRYVIIAWSAEGVNIYQLRTNHNQKQKAIEKFKMLAEYNQWEFSQIEAYLLPDEEELTGIASFLPGVLVNN